MALSLLKNFGNVLAVAFVAGFFFRLVVMDADGIANPCAFVEQLGIFLVDVQVDFDGDFARCMGVIALAFRVELVESFLNALDFGGLDACLRG